MYDSRKYAFECFKLTVTKNKAVFRSQNLFMHVFTLFNEGPLFPQTQLIYLKNSLGFLGDEILLIYCKRVNKIPS
jgi:hypothetical protein